MDQDVLNTIPSTGTKDEIVMVVDCSTSMHNIQAEAQAGVNQFIKDQQEIEGGANLTLVEFASAATILHEHIDINEVPEYTLNPDGWTALCDGIGKGIASVPDTDGKVVIVVVTDGGENASKELNADDIKKLIEDKKEAGWEFVFLAANQDAIATGSNYGFDANASINFAANAQGATQAYGAAAVYTSSLRTKSKQEATLDLEQTIADSDELG